MLRLGIVDFDSSHSIEFTRRFNHCGVDPDQQVQGARVVLGYPGESTISPERIPGFTKEVTGCGVTLVDRPEAVRVAESTRRGMQVLELTTAPGDLGKIIGRQGRTAAALRTLVALTGEKHGFRVQLDIRD